MLALPFLDYIHPQACALLQLTWASTAPNSVYELLRLMESVVISSCEIS
jgi:hypothetical protein